jgi:hypothetical protein
MVVPLGVLLLALDLPEVLALLVASYLVRLVALAHPAASLAALLQGPMAVPLGVLLLALDLLVALALMGVSQLEALVPQPKQKSPQARPLVS